MSGPRRTVDLANLADEAALHGELARVLGFPAVYTHDWNAFIDCMTSLDQPSAELTNVHVASGEVLLLELERVDGFATRCPNGWTALVDCTAFVNWRRRERGLDAVVALAYDREAP